MVAPLSARYEYPIPSSFHPGLIDRIIEESSLHPRSFHGPLHWSHVERIGAWLAPQTGADPAVVAHFAWLHDARRMDEGYDGNHGHRAADYVATLVHEGLVRLDEEQIMLLVEACRHHNTLHAMTTDATIMTCWDADRLDLLRLKIMPDVHYLHTEVARRPDTIALVRALLPPH